MELRESTEAVVFIVDDDASVRRSLTRAVRQAGFEARSFPSAESFLESHPESLSHPACLLLDLKMPGLDGLELQGKLADGPAACPVIFISGHGDIRDSVQAMRQGAVTFLTKPYDLDELLETIREAIGHHSESLASASVSGHARDRIDSMTEREREVMAWVITGSLNKQIADHLGIALQTVKLHRSRVMAKAGVESVAELLRLCDAAGFSAADSGG